MKFSIFSLVLIFCMVCVEGCNYGPETLKVSYLDTISLIEKPDSRAAKKILANHEKLGWFFIPQVIVTPHKDEVILALRIYKNTPDLIYKIDSVEVFLPDSSLLGSDYLASKKLHWHPAAGEWSYQVARVKSYNYSQMMSSGIDSATVGFKVISIVDGRQVIQNKSFDLEVKKVRYYGGR